MTLDVQALERVLQITRRLARPIDLSTLLGQVIDAGREILDADRGTVFLYDSDTDELVVEIGTGLEVIRLPADRGIVGDCVQTRSIVNVPDCYADPRFNPAIDKKTGYRTRCSLTVPLVGHDEVLVGALQLLNKRDGTFGADDEKLAESLAAQCAVALQRARMTEELLEKERMERDFAVAREIQSGFLPKSMPAIDGYEIAGHSRPADETGGDTFDVIALEDGRWVLLVGDATGHGVGPALSATQVRAMLRVTMRMGCDIGRTLDQMNAQLDDDLASNRFVTAFVGTLDPVAHSVRYHSAGQAPILHRSAATGVCTWGGSTAPPLGMLSPFMAGDAVDLSLEPGDVLGVMTDGVFECENADDEEFGEAGVTDLLDRMKDSPLIDIVHALDAAVAEHRGVLPPADDVTILLVRREAG